MPGWMGWVVGLAVAQEAEPLAWTVSWPALATGAVSPGVDPGVLIRFTNPTPRPLRVSADPLAGAFVFADHVPPGGADGRVGHGLGFGHLRAEDVGWVTVAPGETVSHEARLSRWAPACVGGCAAGTWSVSVSDPRPLDGAAPDQVKPDLQGSVLFRVAWPSEAAPAGAWSARIAKRRGNAVLRVRNVNAAPLWVPTGVLSTCSWRLADGSGGGGSEASGGGSPSFGEADAVRLAPRAETVLPLRCGLPVDAVSADVRLDVVGQLWAISPHPDEPTLRWVQGPIVASRP